MVIFHNGGVTFSGTGGITFTLPLYTEEEYHCAESYKTFPKIKAYYTQVMILPIIALIKVKANEGLNTKIDG